MADDSRIPPVDAANLRALAEAADGQRGMPLVVIRDRTSKMLTLARGNLATHPETLFTVTTFDTTLAKSHEFKLEITPEGGVPTDLTKPHDAIFWTSSSIRKFVVPYYAGHINGEVAENLLTRFDKTPDALALIHSPPSDPTLFLADTVHVAVKSRDFVGQIEILSVDEFLSKF
jgi:hypothetical protein